MITAVSENFNNKRKLKEAGGVTIGAAVGSAIPIYLLHDTFHKVTNEEAKTVAVGIKKMMPETDSFESVKTAANKVFESSGLKSKGVKLNIIDGSPESLENLKNIIDNNCNQKKIIDRRVGKNVYEIFKEGGNAGFFTKTNDVVVSSKNISTVFHELGHAMNKNGNIFTRALQNARILTPYAVSIVAPFALGIGLFHKVDKTKPESSKSKTEKTLDFVSNNAGKLTAASYIPIVAEEGLASIRGIKHASKFLPKDTVKKLKQNCLKAWGTYAGAAAAVSAGVTLGVEIANRIRQPKHTKKS